MDAPSTGISLSEDRISAITNFPAPTDKRGVQRLLGMLQFIAKWIPEYSFNVYAISELLKCKRQEDFYWNKEQQECFESIKEIVRSNLKLNYVPADEQLYLYVDSSAVAGGAVLCAGEPETDHFKPVVYFSKKYDEATRRGNSALEAECLNLLYSLEKVKFFTSAQKKIIVRTDAKTVLYLLFGSRKTKNSKLSRMANKIFEYLVDFDIGYCKPTEKGLIIADAISRQFSDEEAHYPAALCKKITKDDITVPVRGVFDFDTLVEIVDKHAKTIVNISESVRMAPPVSKRIKKSPVAGELVGDGPVHDRLVPGNSREGIDVITEDNTVWPEITFYCSGM